MMAAVSFLLLGLGAFLLTRLFAAILYRRLISPLKALPGPFLNSLTSVPHDIACVQGTRHLYLERLHDKYGPVVRISPTEVSFIENSIWRDVWGFKRDKAECPKSDNQERLNGYTGILDANRMDHRRIRRLLSHAFSENSLRQQEHRVQHQVNLLIQGLRHNSGKGPVDMTQWIQWTTFDIMGDLAFGESFNSLQAMKTHPWQQFLLDHIAASVYTGIAQRWGLDRIARLCTPPALMQAVRDFYDLSSKKIEQRMSLGKDRGDFLDHILKYDLITNETKDKDDLKGLRLEELKNTASDIAIAGSETTATVLSGLLFHLLMNPDVYEKVTKEVRTIDSDENITVASTDKLVYFNAVLTEALRIFVPSPIPAARTIPAAGQAVGEHFMPGGTRVCASQYIAYRSPLHFARPKVFIPERWLPEPNRPDEFKGDNATGIFQPFAFGPRNCIGNNLARAEMRLILAKLLWHFDLRRPDSSSEHANEWENWEDRLRMYFLWHKPPLMIDVEAA